MFLTPELAYALEACRAVPSIAQDLCYYWIEDKYKQGGVRPHHLRQLAKLGYLTRTGDARGGNRAYYRLNPTPTAVIRW